jgi:phosphatidylserine/phosphatidylglycerophosphate/cardiolipin synthase-like enzyme
VTPLHRQLVKLLAGRPREEVFAPETATRVLESVKGRELLRSMDGRGKEELALAALRALTALRDDLEAEATQVELVATFPGFTSSTAKDTERTVFDLVEQSTRQIIAVGYWITDGRFEAALHQAAARGVEIMIVSDRGSGHGERLLSRWPAELSLPRVYQDRSSGDEIAKMHGKALFSDGTRLFVSSANFTWSAMSKNIELGVVLTGARVQVARDLFEELLIDSKLLERVRFPA